MRGRPGDGGRTTLVSVPAESGAVVIRVSRDSSGRVVARARFFIGLDGPSRERTLAGADAIHDLVDELLDELR